MLGNENEVLEIDLDLDDFEILDEKSDENEDDFIKKSIDQEELEEKYAIKNRFPTIIQREQNISTNVLLPPVPELPASVIREGHDNKDEGDFLNDMFRDDLNAGEDNNNLGVKPLDSVDCSRVYHCPEKLDTRQTFESVDSATECIQAYARRNGCLFHKAQCHKLKFADALANAVTIADRITFICSKSGKKFNKRAQEHSTQCPALISIKHEFKPDSQFGKADPRSYIYKFTTKLMNLTHNHPLNLVESSVIGSMKDVSTELYEWIKDQVAGGTETASIRKLLTKNGKFGVNSITDGAFNLLMHKARVDTGKAASDLELTQLMEYLKERSDKGNITYSTLQKGKSLEGLLWMSNHMIHNWKRNSQALILDTTYKTNRFDMALFSICCVDDHNRTAVLACALIAHDDVEHTAWVLSEIKRILGDSICNQVATISSDFCSFYTEEFFRNYFPNSKHIRCRWHMWNNITDHCLRYASKERKKEVSVKLRACQYADDLKEFESTWKALIQLFNPTDDKEKIDYLTNNIYATREKWANPWVKNFMHLNNLTSNRSESLHARFKYFDISSKSTLLCVLDNVMYVGSEQQRRNEENRRLKSINKASINSRGVHRLMYSELTRFAAHHMITEGSKADCYEAFNITKRNQVETWKTTYHYSSSNPPPTKKQDKNDRHVTITPNPANIDEPDYSCNCGRYTVWGLPCAHVIIVAWTKSKKKYHPNMIHKRWRLNSMPFNHKLTVNQQIQSINQPIVHEPNRAESTEIALNQQSEMVDMDELLEKEPTIPDSRGRLLYPRQARRELLDKADKVASICSKAPATLYPHVLKWLDNFIDKEAVILCGQYSEHGSTDSKDQSMPFSLPNVPQSVGAGITTREANPREGTRMQRREKQFIVPIEALNQPQSIDSSKANYNNHKPNHNNTNNNYTPGNPDDYDPDIEISDEDGCIIISELPKTKRKHGNNNNNMDTEDEEEEIRISKRRTKGKNNNLMKDFTTNSSRSKTNQ
jgi:hypothetical protein